MIERVFYSVPHKLGYFEKRDDWVRENDVSASALNDSKEKDDDGFTKA